MGSAKRTKQGGSILVYIIIGAVLAAAVVGTIFLVRQRSEQAQRQTPVFTTPSAAPQSQSDKAGNANNASDANQDKQASTPAPSAPATPTPESPKQAPQAAMPHTGPAETTFSFVVLALLTGMTVAYAQSRRSFAFQQS